MQDSKREQGRTNQGDKDQPHQKPDSDATSKETLEDLQKGEKVSDSNSENPAGRAAIPSPDGAPDTHRDGRADGSETGGPM
jgi:hypothetical protein